LILLITDSLYTIYVKLVNYFCYCNMHETWEAANRKILSVRFLTIINHLNAR